MSISAATLGISAFLLFAPAPASQPMETPATWQPRPGDHLLVDLDANMGYLLREDNSRYLRFPVVTGQKRVVRYIGRVYDATTPAKDWVARLREIKGDRVTFGPSGRFLRLFDGDFGTPYGIHEYLYEERMFGAESRYGSMGCIVVQSSILDIIEATYTVNGDRLYVQTRNGIDLEGLVPPRYL